MSELAQAPGNGFTVKEILIRLESKVDAVVEDHEDRIRATEGSIARGKGVLAVLAAAVPVVSALVAVLVR